MTTRIAGDQVLNPWTRTTRNAPYAVPEDLPHLQALADTQDHPSHAPYQLNLTLPPEPSRGVGDQDMAVLKGWRLLRKVRCGTNRSTDFVKAVLVLHYAST